MITIDLGTIEYYDGKANQFVNIKGGIVRFEYSLEAIYDWESKWKKPYLKGGLKDKELVDFYKTMALDPIDEQFITYEVMETLNEYISNPQTATTFTTGQEGQNGNTKTSKGKIHTAEEIYALMFMANIPIEFETRNLNRLLTILKITNSYNSPPKKMNKQDVLKQNSSVNAARKAQMKTKG